MKKIILSLVLAATAFNGWLAASGSASLSTSELQVDDVELVAEADGGGWISGFAEGSGWYGVVILGLTSLYECFATGLKWEYKGKEENRDSRHYGEEKYVCESNFFGTDQCFVTSVSYGGKPTY